MKVLQQFGFCATMLVLVCPLMAREHPACQDAALAGQHYDRQELLSIARSCQAPAVSELYFNRAYHQSMLQKYERFERSLRHFGDRDHRAYIESYRIHIGLAEAFAHQYLRQRDAKVIQRLNRIYEQSGEIAEMRFRGYDQMADWLEKRRQL
jgi:hypothetical protein